MPVWYFVTSSEDVVVEFPHVFGELSQAGTVVERVEQDGFVEAL